MSNLDENMEWQSEFPQLAKLAPCNSYRVPENYFETLSERLETAVFLEALPCRKNDLFTVPENYFQELDTHILGVIAAANLKTLALSSGFGVPENYFDTLNKNIVAQIIADVPKPKIIRLWQNNLFRYASAACLILLTGSGIYYNTYCTEQLKLAAAESATENMLYDIDESVIREHIQESSVATSGAVTNAEMESYILNNLSSNDITNNL